MTKLCGPDYDQRLLNLSLPKYKEFSNTKLETLYLKTNRISKNFKIGILVSGGIDSALLYYLLNLENLKNNNLFKITPYTIERKDGSYKKAPKIIDYVNQKLNLTSELHIVGDPSLPELSQVLSGEDQVLLTNDFVYLGIIEQRPEHAIGWHIFDFKESYRIKYPFVNLQKVHIIDLIYQFNLEHILDLTQTCNADLDIPCNYCNGCRERQWALEEYFNYVRK